MQQTDAVAWPSSQHDRDREGLTRKLSSMLLQISVLQRLISERPQKVSEQRDASLLLELRQGLNQLERAASEMFYELQAASPFQLAEPPDMPLSEALAQLVETLVEARGISSRITFSGQERPLSGDIAALLYTVARETLTRVPTHEGVRRLRFLMDYRPGEIVLNIEDDGIPGSDEQLFDSVPGLSLPLFFSENQDQASITGSGQIMRRLNSMVQEMNGVLVLNSGVEQGTHLQVCVPYNSPIKKVIGDAPSQPTDALTHIKVLVVDPQNVSRAGLRRLLESYPDLDVVGEASNSVQAVGESTELFPNVVIIDTQRLTNDQSLEIIHQLRQLNTEIHVLLLSEQENEKLLYVTLSAGASGYVLKDIAPDELAQAVRAVARGEVLVQPQLAARLLTRFSNQERGMTGDYPTENLTAREREVLQHLARGLRNKEIAARLFVSERTVHFHLANIYAKLHVSGRTEALSKALEQGLLKV